MAKVCCSIEMEPRTLNQGQLNHAREMAADVAQKMEPKEAAAVFIQGIGGVEVEQVVAETEEEKGVNVVGRPCQCACQTLHIESPDPHFNNPVKEPLTAPF